MELSLVSVRDLIKELEKRFDTCIFASHQFRGKEDIYDWHMHGNKMMCGQLGKMVMIKIDNDMVSEPTDGFGIED